MQIAVAIQRVPEGLDYSGIIADFDGEVRQSYDVKMKEVENSSQVGTSNQNFLRWHHISVLICDIF